MVTMTPEQYAGQALCIRCGDDGTGNRFYICAEKAPDGRTFTHQESCERYTYGDLCAACEALYDEEKDS